MAILRNLKISLFVLIILAVTFQETEARRKILKGRRTITRWYMRELGIPAWAIVILVAIGQIVIGGLVYVIMKVCILDKPLPPRYQQVAASTGA